MNENLEVRTLGTESFMVLAKQRELLVDEVGLHPNSELVIQIEQKLHELAWELSQLAFDTVGSDASIENYKAFFSDQGIDPDLARFYHQPLAIQHNIRDVEHMNRSINSKNKIRSFVSRIIPGLSQKIRAEPYMELPDIIR